jgi:hypothetical protein
MPLSAAERAAQAYWVPDLYLGVGLVVFRASATRSARQALTPFTTRSPVNCSGGLAAAHGSRPDGSGPQYPVQHVASGSRTIPFAVASYSREYVPWAPRAAQNVPTRCKVFYRKLRSRKRNSLCLTSTTEAAEQAR